jgi:hypothetical protein
MLPPWMIEEMERQRREREKREQPALRIDMPEPARGREPGPKAREAIVVDLV